VENPYYQHFCGEAFFSHQLPCHPTSLTRWRKRIGEEGCEWLLSETIQAGLRLKAVKPSELKRVVVDTTVQEKNIAHPVDSRLYDKARRLLIALARNHGITLRQTYGKACRELLPKIGRYGHAKQYRRMGRAVKKVKGYLGRVYRDLERKLDIRGIQLSAEQRELMAQVRRLLAQTKKSKGKLYSLHEPAVDCISKGKAHKRYEFGVKVSIATTLGSTFVVGARSYPGNPYDGHTLEDQIQQVETLTDVTVAECFVDRGYKGHGIDHTRVLMAGQKRGIGKADQRRLRRRNSIEPIIGHMKTDGKLARSFLKGVLGDALNVLLCACGQNVRKLLQWLRSHLFWLFFLSLYGVNPGRNDTWPSDPFASAVQ
jgi:IS5 family transposase